MSIKNNLTSIKLSVLDARKRRLVSKNVALRHGRTYHKLSLWKYGVFLAGLVIFMAGGYMLEAKKHDRVMAVDSVKLTKTEAQNLKTVIDEDVSIGVALDLAERANLPVAQDMALLSEINAIKKEVSLQNAELTVAKATPIFDLASTNRGIKTHQVQAGQTIQQIADQYQISANTIKWANNLKSDNLIVGTNLKILPVDGVIYKVKAGDTIEKIAERYKANIQRIQILNDLEVGGLKVGKEVIIPEGILPNEERPGYIAPAPRRVFNAGFAYYNYNGSRRQNMSIIGYDNKNGYGRYYPGHCTSWAWKRSRELGNYTIGEAWGNGGSWHYRVPGRTSRVPSVGAVMEESGHVAVVEEVYADGSIRISEMNYINARWSYVGSGVISSAIVPANYAKTLFYIR